MILFFRVSSYGEFLREFLFALQKWTSFFDLFIEIYILELETFYHTDSDKVKPLNFGKTHPKLAIMAVIPNYFKRVYSLIFPPQGCRD